MSSIEARVEALEAGLEMASQACIADVRTSAMENELKVLKPFVEEFQLTLHIWNKKLIEAEVACNRYKAALEKIYLSPKDIRTAVEIAKEALNSIS